MARRIEVELTSSREDGRWTWRAANARQPKGDLDGSLLYPGAKVGDQFRVEAEFHLDGIEVLEVFPPKAKKGRGDVLELISKPVSDDELVTTVRSGRRDSDRRGGRNRRDDRRDNRGERRGPRSDRGSDRGPRGPREDARPKPKRLRPGRVHRDAALAAVPEEHRPIAEQILKGGLPAVRAAIDKQNADAAEGTPKVEVAPVLAIAEPLVPVMQAAEWRDRADAALAGIDELDLRDLRSVVVAADPTSKDEELRTLAEQLRAGLNERLERDQAAWLEDLNRALTEGRTIRALRLSSRPVKAGSPLPAELSQKLADAAAAALTDDIAPDRWGAVVDALAFSPVRSRVTPAGYPAEPTPELLDAIKRIADRIPEIATHFGIDPAESAAKGRRRRGGAKKRQGSAGGDKPAPSSAAAKVDAPAADGATAADTTAADTTAVETATADSAAPADAAPDAATSVATAESSGAEPPASPATEAPAAAGEPTTDEEIPQASNDAEADAPTPEPAAAEEPTSAEDPAS